MRITPAMLFGAFLAWLLWTSPDAPMKRPAVEPPAVPCNRGVIPQTPFCGTSCHARRGVTGPDGGR